MKYSSSVEVPATRDVVLPFVNDISQYPLWMPLVFSVKPDGDEAWSVELRAKVGIFARSKRIRMTRTINTVDEIVFERAENDGRTHSAWKLAATLSEIEKGTVVSMHLSYGGNLWTGGVLDKVLASQVDAGKSGLLRVVQGA